MQSPSQTEFTPCKLETGLLDLRQQFGLVFSDLAKHEFAELLSMRLLNLLQVQRHHSATG
jgi:hypothetical protein